MARISPFVAWCGGTAVSAAIAWFGVAGAVSSAEQPGPPISVPQVAAAREASPTSSPSGPTATTPDAGPDGPATAGTAESTSAPAPRRPSPSRTRSATPRPSSSSTRPQPRTSSRTAPLVTRTVSGGSAVLSLDPKGVTLVSASPAPGHRGRAVRETYRSSAGETGVLTITFTGDEGDSWIRATWDGRTTEVTTSGG